MRLESQSMKSKSCGSLKKKNFFSGERILFLGMELNLEKRYIYESEFQRRAEPSLEYSECARYWGKSTHGCWCGSPPCLRASRTSHSSPRPLSHDRQPLEPRKVIVSWLFNTVSGVSIHGKKTVDCEIVLIFVCWGKKLKSCMKKDHQR